MTTIPHTPPVFKKSAFNCPYCNAFSNMIWVNLSYYQSSKTNYTQCYFAFCRHCEKESLWLSDRGAKNGKMLEPDRTIAPPPHELMPKSVKKDYLEASSICNRSPKASCALLRLAVQKLCIELGEEGKNLNTDIKSLIEKGLPPKIAKSLDILRVIGNNAVHPGQIDDSDIEKFAHNLFELLNFVVEDMIARPKKIDEMFDGLPEGAKDQIADRDKNKK